MLATLGATHVAVLPLIPELLKKPDDDEPWWPKLTWSSHYPASWIARSRTTATTLATLAWADEE